MNIQSAYNSCVLENKKHLQVHLEGKKMRGEKIACLTKAHACTKVCQFSECARVELLFDSHSSLDATEVTRISALDKVPSSLPPKRLKQNIGLTTMDFSLVRHSKFTIPAVLR